MLILKNILKSFILLLTKKRGLSPPECHSSRRDVTSGSNAQSNPLQLAPLKISN